MRLLTVTGRPDCQTSAITGYENGSAHFGDMGADDVAAYSAGGCNPAGSYEVTPPGRSRAYDAAHRADGSTQRQQPTRQAYGESDPTGDATPILTGLRSATPVRPLLLRTHL